MQSMKLFFLSDNLLHNFWVVVPIPICHTSSKGSEDFTALAQIDYYSNYDKSFPPSWLEVIFSWQLTTVRFKHT